MSQGKGFETYKQFQEPPLLLPEHCLKLASLSAAEHEPQSSGFLAKQGVPHEALTAAMAEDFSCCLTNGSDVALEKRQAWAEKCAIGSSISFNAPAPSTHSPTR